MISVSDDVREDTIYKEGGILLLYFGDAESSADDRVDGF